MSGAGAEQGHPADSEHRAVSLPVVCSTDLTGDSTRLLQNNDSVSVLDPFKPCKCHTFSTATCNPGIQVGEIV